MGLIAGAAPGTQLLRVRRAGLEQLAAAGQFARWVPSPVDNWVTCVSDSLLPGLPPRKFTVLEPDTAQDLPADSVARSLAGVLWVRHDQGSSHYLGRPELPSVNGAGRFALRPIAGWKPTRPHGPRRRDDDPDRPRRLVAALQQFHALALATLAWDAQRGSRPSARASSPGSRTMNRNWPLPAHGSPPC